MNKYAFLMVLVFVIMFLTVIGNEISALTVTQNLGSGRITSFTFSIDYVSSIANTWFKMVTFSIEGIPNIFLLLFFLPLNMGAI